MNWAEQWAGFFIDELFDWVTVSASKRLVHSLQRRRNLWDRNFFLLFFCSYVVLDLVMLGTVLERSTRTEKNVGNYFSTFFVEFGLKNLKNLIEMKRLEFPTIYKGYITFRLKSSFRPFFRFTV